MPPASANKIQLSPTMPYPELIGRKLTFFIRAVMLAGICVASGCAWDPGSPPASRPSAPDLTPVTLDKLPGWSSDDLAGFAPALQAQCRLPRPPAPTALPCNQPGELSDPVRLRAWLQTHFMAQPLVQPVVDPVVQPAAQTSLAWTQEGMITGYHEPLLTGSRLQQASHQVPVYPPPGALQSGDSQWSRAAIRRDPGRLGTPLLWLDDPVEAFFMQVQGSGQVQIREPNGTSRRIRLAYAQHNGHIYVAIGRAMVQAGILTREEATAPSIKAWLRANPAQAQGVMDQNPRYIFFRETLASANAHGPTGALGVPLTALRSVAVDPNHVALGSMLWLDAKTPSTSQPLRRLMLAQDVGSAIVGAVRIDVFWGSDERAQIEAGLARQPGRVWRLIPRSP
jgi:membrane-bound lytic murein transglycosylase A